MTFKIAYSVPESHHAECDAHGVPYMGYVVDPETDEGEPDIDFITDDEQYAVDYAAELHTYYPEVTYTVIYVGVTH